MSEEGRGEYGLVMPFVTTDEGGPHDGHSYVCGWECGWIAAHLEAMPLEAVVVQWQVHRENKPQLDLIAMKAKFTMTDTTDAVYPDGGPGLDEWCVLEFRRDWYGAALHGDEEQ